MQVAVKPGTHQKSFLVVESRPSKSDRSAGTNRFRTLELPSRRVHTIATFQDSGPEPEFGSAAYARDGRVAMARYQTYYGLASTLALLGPGGSTTRVTTLEPHHVHEALAWNPRAPMLTYLVLDDSPDTRPPWPFDAAVLDLSHSDRPVSTPVEDLPHQASEGGSGDEDGTARAHMALTGGADGVHVPYRHQ
jgi:hypothetical protein